jgi:predicted MFS family arabinose efflux permease
MTPRQLKIGYFFLEGLNSLGTTYFLYYLYFYMHARFGFTNATNLRLSALIGFVYMAAASFGGRYAQRAGPFSALRIGFGVMAAMLVCGAFQTTVFGLLAVLVVWTVGLCFTWPTLEALASQHETGAGLQRMVGIYNLVWAATAGVAYFCGGALLERLGMQSLFWLPLGVHLLQWGLLEWLRAKAARVGVATPPHEEVRPAPEAPAHAHPAIPAASFLKLAWIANPFAYVAINTVVAVIPGIAAKMDFHIAQAGVFCSLWFFSRLAAFLVLWLWSGWHYRFGWLAAAYVALIASFLAILLVSNLWIIILAQIVFGFAVGLCYYSSLYYSMDVGEAKSAHGGLHEAAIGCGIFAGPAVGATALYLWPHHPNAGAWAVAALLLVGGVTMGVVRAKAGGIPRIVTNRHL